MFKIPHPLFILIECVTLSEATLLALSLYHISIRIPCEKSDMTIFLDWHLLAWVHLFRHQFIRHAKVSPPLQILAALFKLLVVGMQSIMFTTAVKRFGVGKIFLCFW